MNNGNLPRQDPDQDPDTAQRKWNAHRAECPRCRSAMGYETYLCKDGRRLFVAVCAKWRLARGDGKVR